VSNLIVRLDKMTVRKEKKEEFFIFSNVGFNTC
jgi:hypothetical protein